MSVIDTKDAVKAAPSDKWLDAYQNLVASLYTFTQCMALADVQADGDWKLIIADLGTGTYDMKLKVFKNTNLLSEHILIDIPIAVVTLYVDVVEPRVPVIAVASGPYVYVYRNLKPFFKFTLPALDVDPLEEDLWAKARDNSMNVFLMREALDQLRVQGHQLTAQSLRFLQLESKDLEPFAELYKNAPLKRQSVLTCMTTLKKSMAEEDAISCLVLGSESKFVYIVDSSAYTVLSHIEVPSVPVFISVNGIFDVDYRLVIACRNGCVYSVKRDSDRLHQFELNSQPVGLEKVGKNIYVGCMDDTLRCYTPGGKKLWTVKLPAGIMTMEALELQSKSVQGVFVALSNSQVHVYREKYLVDIIAVPDVVNGLRFGHFGREDNCLVMTTRGGSLFVKILKRNAEFTEKDVASGPPASQSVKLNVPKKTKLFVDQTLQERETAVTMHRTFQRDLYLLRLKTAREYVKALENSMNPISSDPDEPIKLNAQVQGIGPTFKLTVNLQNTSMTQVLTKLFITFDYDEKLYSFHRSFIEVPMLVPSLTYKFTSLIDCLNDKGLSGNVKVYVLKKEKSVPIITGVISMPVSETGVEV